jgi:hypothetical protein
VIVPGFTLERREDCVVLRGLRLGGRDAGQMVQVSARGHALPGRPPWPLSA